jgi:hypothetical protein
VRLGDWKVANALIESLKNPAFWTVDGLSAPYCLLLRPESPRCLGHLDLTIETASNSMARSDAPGSRKIVHRECRQLQHNVALSGSIPLQPAGGTRDLRS